MDNSPIPRRKVLELAALLGFPVNKSLNTKIWEIESKNSSDSGEIIIGLPDDVTNLEDAAQKRTPDGSTVVDTNDTLGFAVVSLPPGTDSGSEADSIDQRSDTRYAEQNGTMSADSVLDQSSADLIPNDEQYSNQYAPEQINAPSAWGNTTGSSDITIAIVDTGTKYDHKDLAANADNSVSNSGKDFVDGDDDPYPEDFDGSQGGPEIHGTHVSGIAGAVTDNGDGVAGTSDCSLLFVRVLGTNGSGTFASVASGIQWATDNGADIINLSLGAAVASPTVGDALDYAANQDVISVGAAGNNGSKPNNYYPASHPECIAVSAVNAAEDFAFFSNFGDYVELTAPGVRVLSTWPEKNGNPSDEYESISGTSMATPVVAGVAGLVRSMDPSLSNDEVRRILTNTATDLGLSDEEQGAGQVDAKTAVGMAGVDLSTTDVTNSTSAVFQGSGGDYTISAAGADVWDSDDEYGAIYESDVDGDVVATTTVESQDATDPWAKSGVMIGNDLTAPGSSVGDVILAVTPGNGFALQWDSDGDGFINEDNSTGSASYPCELRLTKSGTKFVGEYSTDGGSTWTTVGSVTIDKTASSQDVGVFATSHNSGTVRTTEFTGFSTKTPSTDKPTVDTTAGGNAMFQGSGGDYTISAAGADVWDSDDEYGAIYESDVDGDVVATTTVESQDATHPWAKSGVMVGNDLTAPGSSVGDVTLAVTPGNGFVLQWDGDGDGFVDKNNSSGSASYPCELRLTKMGAEFTGEYSMDGGSSWTTIGTVTIVEANTTQDVGVFTTSHNSGTVGATEFAGFSTEAPGTDKPTVDTTAGGDATFQGSGGDYTISAAGADVWKTVDEYGAIYESDVDGDVVATTTVESQDATNQWAKSGVMIGNDLTAPGSSVGDVILAVTPGNGFALHWDSDGDGFVDKNNSSGSASYPCELRLTKMGAEFTGEYSMDGGSSWTTIGTVTIAEANTTQDVGVFVTSHNSGTVGTTEFTAFSTKML